MIVLDASNKELTIRDEVLYEGKTYIVTTITPEQQLVLLPEEGEARTVPANQVTLQRSLIQDLLSLNNDDQLAIILAGLQNTPLSAPAKKRTKKEAAIVEVVEI